MRFLSNEPRRICSRVSFNKAVAYSIWNMSPACFPHCIAVFVSLRLSGSLMTQLINHIFSMSNIISDTLLECIPEWHFLHKFSHSHFFYGLVRWSVLLIDTDSFMHLLHHTFPNFCLVMFLLSRKKVNVQRRKGAQYWISPYRAFDHYYSSQRLHSLSCQSLHILYHSGIRVIDTVMVTPCVPMSPTYITADSIIIYKI